MTLTTPVEQAVLDILSLLYPKPQLETILDNLWREAKVVGYEEGYLDGYSARGYDDGRRA